MLGQLFNKETQAIFFNYKEKPVQRMLDFDFVCGRETPSVAALVTPGSSGGFQKLFFGKNEIAIPVYGSIAEATRKHPKADVFINYASFRSAYESSLQALNSATLRVIAIIAEGVPEKDTKHLIAVARANNKVIIGPATVGGVQAGAFKIGDTAGTLDNIVACKLHRPGSVGFVSKSGGMSNEMYNHIPAIKMIVVLGELGGADEYGLVEAIKAGAVTKPVVAWVSGTCAKLVKSEVQSVYDRLVAAGTLVPAADVPAPAVPQDLAAAVAAGKVRVPTHIVSTICDDRGEEPTYYGVSMSELIEGDYGIGDVISLLWFKRKLPKYATKFIEMCVMMCADHGPCVSGAHNAIVTSRAGKDIVSSLVSGLLTIGPRFGGAIDDAARYFKAACDAGQSPSEFVEGLKKKGIRVAGIGHRIKSKDNRDKRVELLQQYARKFFPSTRYLDYAVEVETYTLQKAPNLVLNVDGCIGALFLDLLASSGCFSDKEAKEIVEIGYLNALFVVARSIGLVGHALDQKRLQQPLYRHPWEDVLYTS
eukprot:XP_001701955.1 ATP citrate lyase, subunit B [Chlamydomonas reinhardtii]